MEPQEADVWYVCYCEPKRALPLTRELAETGHMVECPSFQFRRRLPRKAKTELIERALIGGMFFCRVDSWPLQGGVAAGISLDLVRRLIWLGEPAVVTDEDLAGLRLAGRARTDSKTQFAIGDAVSVDFGPFKGARARITEMRSKRFVVEVEGLSIPMEIPPFLLGKNQA